MVKVPLFDRGAIFDHQPSKIFLCATKAAERIKSRFLLSSNGQLYKIILFPAQIALLPRKGRVDEKWYTKLAGRKVVPPPYCVCMYMHYTYCMYILYYNMYIHKIYIIMLHIIYIGFYGSMNLFCFMCRSPSPLAYDTNV